MSEPRTLPVWMRWRFIICAAMLVVVGALAFGMGKLRYALDYKIFFPPGDETVIALDKVHEEFWQSNTLLFVIKNEADDILNAADLTAVHDLTQASWRVPYAYRVDSITNYQNVSASDDVIDISALVADPARDLRDDKITALRGIVLNEPDLLNRLIAPDAKTTGVLITLQMPPENPFGGMEATFRAREMVAEFAAEHPHLTIKLTGLAAVETTYPEVSQQDFNTLTPAMYVLILSVTALMFRNIGAVLTVLVTISLATVATMGFGGWVGFEMTALTGLLPTIVLVIGVADIVHIIVAARALSADGRRDLYVTTEAMRVTFRPITVTSLTTAIGFASLAFAASPPYQEFGLHAAVGTLFAYGVTITLAPVIIPFLRFKPQRTVEGRLFDPVIAALTARPGFWLAVSGLVLLPFAYPFASNQINDRIVENFDETIPVREATEFAFDNLTGIYRLEYVAYAAERDISDPGYLQELDAFAEWLKDQPEVSAVSVLSDTIKKLNRAMHNDDPTHYRLPTQPGAAAQMLLLYEMSLPFGMDLSNQVNIDKSASRIIATLDRLDTKEIRAFKAKADQWWTLNAARARITPDAGTGETIIFANLTHINIEHMVVGVALALVLITVLIAVFLHSVPLGILSIFPNALPFLLMFGIWGIVNAEINTAAANAVAIVYGLVVDATVHLIHDYKRQRRETSLSVEEAVVAAYRTVLPAITANTFILLSGFLVLTLSPFSMNADLGMLGAIGIFCAFLIDVLVLPPLLVLFETLRSRKTSALIATP